jgi:head-tail adaptor
MTMAQDFAGALNERVIIERRVPLRDAAGDDVGAWAAVETVFAAVQPDGVFAGQLAGEAARSGRRWRVLLRWREDLDLMVRLRWRGQILAVRAIDGAVRRGALVTLLCDGSPQ